MKKNSNFSAIRKVINQLRPNLTDLASVTDSYFTRTKSIVSKFGDTNVTYAIFMRRPVLSALNPALDWLFTILGKRNTKIKVDVSMRKESM